MSKPSPAELQERLLEANDALLAGRLDQVVRLVDASIPVAERAKLSNELGLLHTLRGEALMAQREGGRAPLIEEAINSLDLAVRLAPDPRHLADVTLKLAIAYSERLRGDPNVNAERAVDLMRATLDGLWGEVPVDFRAHAKASLAIALTRRRLGSHVDNLKEAVGLLGEAVAVVTPDGDVENWAHRQINLANALLELALEGETELAQAEAAFEVMIEHGELLLAASRDAQLGYAHFGLGIARRSPSDEFFDSGAAAEWEETGDVGSIEPSLLHTLGSARNHLERAVSLFAPDSVEAGWAFGQLATVRGRLGDEEGSLDAGRSALGGLRPDVAPAECLALSKRLGEFLALRGEWEEAAEALRLACAASELRFLGARDLNQRELESHEATSLGRWAAFALARVGRPQEAVMVLESARTREQRLRQGSGEDPLLAGLPAHLRSDYESALSALAAAPLGPTGARESRRVVEALDAIRAQPGFEEVGLGTPASALPDAAAPGVPLIYVNPTPYGTVLLEVRIDAGVSEVNSIFLDTPNSVQVLHRLLGGEVAEHVDSVELEREAASYLNVVRGHDPGKLEETGELELAQALEEILPWLGQHIVAPLHRRLEEIGASGVTLIPCGLIGLAPLHAATWLDEEGQPTCLLDHLEVRFAPSAYLLAKARDRLATEAPIRRLVALGNPESAREELALPFAGAEVHEISALFAARGDATVSATGAQATQDFLLHNARCATHIHLACHARGGTLERADTGVYLHGGLVPAHLLGGLNRQARLVVVSACQSAISDTVMTPDEAFSITTALLGAGCSGVVASLWPVWDVSTAILMTRFYEEMLQYGHSPPAALRAAALWLRDLTEAEEQEFLAAHPALQAEVADQEGRGRERWARRSRGAPAIEGYRPYAEPEHWAAFVIAGL